METIAISLVTRAGLPLLETALRHLAADLGDAYTTDPETLETATCGPDARCLALLAQRDGALVGALFASPIFSTIRGGAGLYVSDLWVAEQARGTGLGRRLLSRALEEGRRRDAGRFLKLAVYHDNTRARAVYDRLGFAHQSTEAAMILSGPALNDLRERQ